MKWLIVSLLLVTSCAAEDYETYDFVFIEVNLGDSAEFVCDSEFKTENSSDLLWILPNYDNIPTNATEFPEDLVVNTTDDNSTIGLYTSLSISNAEQSDFGSYYCVFDIDVFNSSSGVYMQRFGLNLKGPYFEDTWEKYSSNVAIAFASMLSFLAASAYVFVVYKYRWIPGEEWEEEDYKTPSGIEVVPMTSVNTRSNGAASGLSNGSFENKGMDDVIESERL